MAASISKKQSRIKRKKRIRKRVNGTQERPRLSVFRSARHIYAQVIDDTTGSTLASASSVEKTTREQPKFENKTAMAVFVGKLVAQRSKEKGVIKVVFDRNGFLYHGRIKAVSDGAREGGLEF
jgi:large subunit ribosomal protein L18